MSDPIPMTDAERLQEMMRLMDSTLPRNLASREFILAVSRKVQERAAQLAAPRKAKKPALTVIK